MWYTCRNPRRVWGIGVRVALSPPCARSGPGAAKAYCEKFLMPEKLTGPAEPPVTLSADQSQVPERGAARQHRAYSYIAADARRAQRGKGEKGVEKGRTGAGAGAAVDGDALRVAVDGDGVGRADEVHALQ